MSGNTCVLIMSCDRYHDLWDPFFHFFEKHWPDCPYPVYLATNTKTYNRKNVNIIHSNFAGTWSEETLIILNKLNFSNIIYLQDDYFLVKKVSNKCIEDLLKIFDSKNADYLRLFPSPGPDTMLADEDNLGLISKTAEYRTSLQCAIWKLETFKTLLVSTENQWEFEKNSPKRSVNFLFLSVGLNTNVHIKHQIFPVTYYYLTAVLRGKWRWGAYQLCKKENIQIDTKYRKVESLNEKIQQSIYDGSPLFVKKIIDYLKKKVHD